MKFSLLILLNLICNIESFRITLPDKRKSVSKFVQDSELKHSRVAMISTLCIPLIELCNGNNPGIYELSKQPINTQLSIISLIGFYETLETFKSQEIFDPLKISNDFNIYKLKILELFMGRIAMIGALCIILQEQLIGITVLDFIEIIKYESNLIL